MDTNSYIIMEQYNKHQCIEQTMARKLFTELDKTTYIAVNKKNENVTLHISPAKHSDKTGQRSNSYIIIA